MQTLEIMGKYKTIDRLFDTAEFECFIAVNIEEAQQTQVVICRFQNAAAIRRLLPIFYVARERGCDELLELFVTYGEFCVVFEQIKGVPLAQALASATPMLRRTMQEALLSRALELSRLPDELCNAVLRVETPLWQADAGKLVFPFCPSPELMTSGNAYFTALATLSEQILRRRWSSMREELEFLDGLIAARPKTIAQIYTAWRAFCADTAERYVAHYESNAFSLFFYGLKTHLFPKKAKGGNSNR